MIVQLPQISFKGARSGPSPTFTKGVMRHNGSEAQPDFARDTQHRAGIATGRIERALQAFTWIAVCYLSRMTRSSCVRTANYKEELYTRYACKALFAHQASYT